MTTCDSTDVSSLLLSDLINKSFNGSWMTYASDQTKFGEERGTFVVVAGEDVFNLRKIEKRNNEYAAATLAIFAF